MLDNAEFDGDIILNEFSFKNKIHTIVRLYGGHYDENNNFIKAYIVSIEINDINKNMLDEFFEIKNYGIIGWDPYSGKHGTALINKIISGFENIQKYIDEIKNIIIMKNII